VLWLHWRLPAPGLFKDAMLGVVHCFVGCPVGFGLLFHLFTPILAANFWRTALSENRNIPHMPIIINFFIAESSSCYFLMVIMEAATVMRFGDFW